MHNYKDGKSLYLDQKIMGVNSLQQKENKVFSSKV